jgi:AcrR family transcriptional regulator
VNSQTQELGNEAPDRPMRADARRNREKLIEAARAVFTRDGAAASLEAIAAEAGVGIGTLYRHFPTRIDVVEAVYLSDVGQLAETARRVVSELEPWPALVEFFAAFTRYAETKQALLTEIHQSFERDPGLKSQVRETINGSFQLVMDYARDAGVIRDDVDGNDVTQIISPICINTGISTEQRTKLIGMILDGLRARSPSPG